MSTGVKTDTQVSTAQVADACIRLKIPFRVVPPEIKPVVTPSSMLVGPVIPVRHYGSVDVFFEALEGAPENGVLVIDNGGRADEACIGDLSVLEFKQARMSGVVVWGLHRDTRELIEIGFPVFSAGASPAGPNRLDPREADCMLSARLHDFYVTRSDTAFAGCDGVIFVETARAGEIMALARSIRQTEMQQAESARNGVSLRQQFQFQKYLHERNRDSTYTFRQHLRSLSKSIEE